MCVVKVKVATSDFYASNLQQLFIITCFVSRKQIKFIQLWSPPQFYYSTTVVYIFFQTQFVGAITTNLHFADFLLCLSLLTDKSQIFTFQPIPAQLFKSASISVAAFPAPLPSSVQQQYLRPGEIVDCLHYPILLKAMNMGQNSYQSAYLIVMVLFFNLS